MLCRIAGNCYWMARYLERAENDARLLRMAAQAACWPEAARDPLGMWSTALEVGGSLDEYLARHGALTADGVLRFMAIDARNPSSIRSCLRAARDNARTARHLMPDLLWDAINGAWIEVQEIDEERLATLGAEGFVDWTIARCRLIAGCCDELWRDTVPHVIALGRSVERADVIARILAELLPKLLAEGTAPLTLGTPRARRWRALLDGLGLSDSWRRSQRGPLEPLSILHFILLHPTAPQCLLVNVRTMAEAIRGFAPGREGAALQTAREIEARLIATDLTAATRAAALDAFCRDLTALTNRLGLEVQRDHFSA
ncbi:MAG: alpha-E domain-containing protein [Planctomycetota bacterium]|nr:alpha-E domain-containing protein [Planctomycetota bacterium]MCX8040076.1 alpha-E domain-containing protein [Planctomycetota bacterium]